MHIPSAHQVAAKSAALFSKWRPTELMEWAKFGHVGVKHNLTCSGIPAVRKLADIPGGPYIPDLWGENFAGHEQLKVTLAAMYNAAPQNILIAQGASECNFLIAGAALSDGGTAIVETPCYQPLLRSIEVWADRIIRLPRRPADRYQPDPHEFRHLLTPETKLVVLTNLHNPSQVALEADRLHEIIRMAAAVNAEVLLDEVYLRMVEPDHRKHGFSLGGTSTNSLGKSWGLDTLRVGWSVGPTELIDRAYRLNNLLGVNQPYVTEDLAWRILSSPSAVQWFTQRARKAAEGWRLCEEFLHTVPQVSYVKPDGGISVYLKLPGNVDDHAFVNNLMEQYSTAVFPGSFFENPGFIRISFGAEQAEVIEGLRHLSTAIRELP